MAKNIQLIIASTRTERIGNQVAEWAIGQLKAAGVSFNIIDLQKEDLPFFIGKSPLYNPPETPEAMAWAKKIGESDGFIIVTPEYNRSVPAPLKNALDYVSKEWKGKPVMTVSYGYIDGGTSVTKHLSDIYSWFGMREVPGVSIKVEPSMLDNGKFTDTNAAFADYAANLQESAKTFAEQQ